MAKILLVEDNEMNRDMLERRLVRRGFEVVVAVDGVESIEKAKHEKPDLILMDMGLPVMDGYQATRLLKENRETRAIPILGLSAHAMSGAAQQALDAGCDDYDTKPVDVKRLMTKMQALLQRTAPTAAATSAGEPGAAGAPDAPPELPTARVLIAEGNAENTDTLCRRVTACAMSYEVARDGEEALQRLGDPSFSLVLVSPSLPGRDGLQVLRWMREQEGLQEVPVLVIGEESDEDVLRCLRAGAQDCLSPPFRREVVEWRLKSCLDRRDPAEVKLQDEELAREKRRSQRLLKALMPDELIQELQTTRAVRPRRLQEAAIIAARVVELPRYCNTEDLQQAFGVLQKLAASCEEMAQGLGLEPLLVGGDAFVAGAGLTQPSSEPVLPCVRCALKLQRTVKSYGFSLAVGVHVGPAVTGLVGSHKFRFHVWGEAIHLSRLLRDLDLNAPIRVSARAWDRVASHFHGESLGHFALADDEIQIYRVDGPRA